MDNQRQPGYYAVIPANIRYDSELRPNAKLLYGELTALAGADGYCWASNQYFAALYGLSVNTISELITSLEKRGYIAIEMATNSKGRERHIYAGSFMVCCREGSPEKSGYPPDRGSPEKSGEGSPEKSGVHNVNNLNITNNPLPPIARKVKFLPEMLVRKMVDYAGRDEALLSALLSHAEMRHKLRKPITTDRTLTLLLNKLDKLSGGSRELKLALINKAIEYNWLSYFPLKADEDPRNSQSDSGRNVVSPEVEEW